MRDRVKAWAAACFGIAVLLSPAAAAQGAQGAGGPSGAVAPSLDAARAVRLDVPESSDRRLAARARRGPLGRGELRRKLFRLARRAPGASGYYVYDIDAGRRRVLFDRAEGQRRKLASNEKLFTTATALHVLGEGGRLATRVKASGAVTAAGRLKGDLYLVGGGDPSFGAEGVADLARDVRRAGITSVRGSVIGDDRIFDRRRGVPDSGYGPSPYIAPLSGLTYGGSTYTEDPAVAAARTFRDRLREKGVRVGGAVGVGSVPRDDRGEEPLGEYESPTIAALAAATNKVSNNFYAEMLLKGIWAAKGHLGTTRGGTRAVERYARELGSGVSAKDGSGLTDRNLSSPRDVVRMLVGVRREAGVGGALFDSLAIAGQEGTLDDRMEGTVAAGHCRGKTGTINGVSNLSGYCRSGHGLVAFSLLMNGVGNYDHARSIQDRMAVQIARYRP